jgi:heme oxygenase (biliverdin-IX-beta and delta-forming)
MTTLDQHLKEYTREEHAALEKKFLHIIRKINNSTDYGAFLVRLYGYYFALECVLNPYLENSAIDDYPSRRKSHRLVDDLKRINEEHHPIELCNSLPEVESFHAALGVLYVLEGSTLGGKIIASIISSRLGSTDGFSFFLSYGNGTAEMWSRFRSHLQKPYTHEQQEEIVRSATVTFSTFKNWLAKDE